jgi:hypothetical protein
MGLGSAALNTNQHRQASGSPFVPGSADNGLSVDTTSGEIVLGNDVGGADAALLDNREIPMNGFGIDFTDNGDGLFSRLSAGNMLFEDTVNTLAAVISQNGIAVQNGTGDIVNVFPDIITVALSGSNNPQAALRKNELQFITGIAGQGLHISNVAGLFAILNNATAQTLSVNQAGDVQVLKSVLISGDAITGGLQINSNGTGPNSFAQVLMHNNLGSLGQLFLTASSNTGPAGPDALGFVTDGAGGIKILASNSAAAILFGTGNSLTTRMVIKPTGTVNISGMQVFASNALAIAGGLVAGDLYRSSIGAVSVVF